MNVHAGVLIDGRYEITGTLGSGGFGTVYKANHLQLERVVALKMLQPELAEGPDAAARFEREAQALEALKHRNLVLFYGYGVWRTAPYIVMEYVQGTSLQELLEEKRVSLAECFELLQQVCDALICAHSNGIVHRDLKPANVMVLKSNEGPDHVKLIDFGLAKVLPSSGTKAQELTEVGYAVGSVFFMSPEQCVGAKVDSRSDIYSLGCILHACAAGAPPFSGEHSVLLMQKHVCEPPQSLEQCCPGQIFPHGLQNVINKALAKDPEERYQTVEDFKHDLVLVEHGRENEIYARHAKPPVNTSSDFHQATHHKLSRTAASLILLGSVALFAYWLSFGHHTNAVQTSAELFRQARALEESHAVTPEIHPIYQASIELNKSDHLLDPYRLSQAQLRVAIYLLARYNYAQAQGYARDSLITQRQMSNQRNAAYYDACLALVRACHASGHPAAATKYCTAGLKIDTHGSSPASIENSFAAAILNALDRGNRAEAMSVYKLLIWTSANPETWIIFEILEAENLYDKGDYQGALKRCNKVLALIPGMPPHLKSQELTIDLLTRNTCRCYAQLGKWSDFEQALDRDLKLPGCNPHRALLLEGVRAAHQGNWQDVASLLATITAAVKQNPELYTVLQVNEDAELLAQVCQQSGHTDLAKTVAQTNNQLAKVRRR